MLVTIATGGGGAFAKVGTTAARVGNAGRRTITAARRLPTDWTDATSRFSRQHGNLPTRVRNTWQSRPIRGSVGDANFAQNNKIKPTKPFSDEGQEILTEMTGIEIRTGEDLTRALREGLDPSRVQVDYVVINGQKVILNTRTSSALRQADTPQSHWSGREQSGIVAFVHPTKGPLTFDQLARDQLSRNGLPPTGSPRLGIDPPRMVLGEPFTKREIATRQFDNDELMQSQRFAEDLQKAGTSQADIDMMFAGNRPLGFASDAQFEQFQHELGEALRADGLADAEIGLKGTATTFYSENPGKPLGHHWDADPANPGDYDLNITSNTMVDHFARLRVDVHPKYGVFRTRHINANFPSLDSFRKKWTASLGRDVNFVGYPEPTVRDVTEYVLTE